MTTDLREKIAEVLAGHRDVIGRKVVRCECGDWVFAYEVLGITEVAAEHRRHVAEAILAAIGDRVLPEGGETRQEWAYTEVRGGERPYLLHHTCCRDKPNTAHHHQFTRFVTAWFAAGPNDYWPRYIGPWRPVDTEEAPA